MSPSRYKVYKNVEEGNQFIKEGLYTQALNNFKEVLKVDPDHFLALRRKAEIMLKLGRYKSAIVVLKKLLKTKPNCFICYYSLGESYRALEKNLMAVYYYEKALELKPNHFKSLRNLSWTLYKLKKYKRGFNIVNRLYQARDFNTDLAIIRIRFLIKLQQYKEALISSNKGLLRAKKSDSRAQFFSFKGEVFLKTNKWDRAKKYYDEALSLQPLMPSALLGIGKYYYVKKEKKLAIKYITQALRSYNKLFEGYYLLARLYEGSDEKKARNFYKKFYKRAKNDAEYSVLITEVKKKIASLNQKNL